MEKAIKIGDKNVRLCNNISWAMIYRDQFGIDIIPALMPMLAGALDIFSGLVKEVGKPDEISIEDIAALANGEALIDAVVHLGGLEFVDFINVTWALAKCADEDIPDPKEWIEQFDTFPMDIIAPEVFALIFKGVVSSKNLKRLNNLKKRVQPKLTSKQSSLQESNED